MVMPHIINEQGTDDFDSKSKNENKTYKVRNHTSGLLTEYVLHSGSLAEAEGLAEHK